MTAKDVADNKWIIILIFTGVIAVLGAYVVPTISSGSQALHKLALHEKEQVGILKAQKTFHDLVKKSLEQIETKQ